MSGTPPENPVGWTRRVRHRDTCAEYGIGTPTLLVMREGEYLALDRDKGQSLADSLVGKSRSEAEAAATGWRLNAVVFDLDATGGRVAVTADHRPGRMRLFVSKGRVVRATYG